MNVYPEKDFLFFFFPFFLLDMVLILHIGKCLTLTSAQSGPHMAFAERIDDLPLASPPCIQSGVLSVKEFA